jgi:uncharacterized protein
MHIGTLEAIWRYPIKSLRGEALTEILVREDGLDGDRVRALVVRSGHARVGKTLRGKEDDRLHLARSPDEPVQRLSERGVDVELQGDEGRYFDDAPVSLIVDRWLDGLRRHAGYEVEPQRYRPNFFVHASNGFVLAEAALLGRELLLGGVCLRVSDTIKRCVTPTYDPNGGTSDPELLRFVAQERENTMGVYCEVLRTGVVRTGDSLDLASS